jgi:hypothetical protein
MLHSLGKHDKRNVLRNTVNDYCIFSVFILNNFVNGNSARIPFRFWINTIYKCLRVGFFHPK